MIKILVADDNNLIRQSIITTIDWKSINCCIVAEASDGVEALRLAKEYCPDIVITDIRMPEMDGLELTEKLKMFLPSAKVVVITGYDEFKYAQKALKLGTSDFILKPVNNDELQSIIVELVSELKSIKEFQAENKKLAEARQKKYLMDVIQGLKLTEDDNDEKQLFCAPTFQRFSVFIIKPEFLHNKHFIDDEQIRQFVSCSQKAINNTESFFGFDFVHFWLDYGIVVIALPRKSDSDRNLNIKMIEVCNRIFDLMTSITAIKFIIGISNIHNGMDELRKSYNEAQFALNCRFFIDNKKIIHAGSLQSKRILNEYPMMKKINLLYEYIKSGEEGTSKILDEVFDDIRMNESSDVNYVKSLLTDICLTAGRIIYEKGSYRHELKSSSEIYSDISLFVSITQAFEYVREYITEITTSLGLEPERKYSTATKKVIDYLNNNYDRKVSLQEISDFVSLSPAHVSRLIKKETGESVIDLFNNIKINLAVKLLKDTNLKVYEVANKVGIENYAYFYQLFKKITGIAPTEYNR